MPPARRTWFRCRKTDAEHLVMGVAIDGREGIAIGRYKREQVGTIGIELLIGDVGDN